LVRRRSPWLAGLPVVIACACLGIVAAFAYADFTRSVGSESHFGELSSGAIALVFGGVTPFMVVVGLFLATHDRARSTAAWIASIVCALVFFFTAARAGHTDRDHLVPPMPVAGELTVDGPPMTLGALSLSLRREVSSRSDGELVEGCVLTVASHHGAETLRVADQPLASCPRVRVRHGAKSDVVVIEAVERWYADWANEDAVWHVETVRSTRDGAPVSLDAHRFQKEVRVPPDWVGVAAFAAAGALGLLFIGRRWRRRASRLVASLEDAKHEGDGWFTLADGRRIRLPSAAALAKGTFAVRVREEPAAAAYRTPSAVTLEHVRPGAKNDHAERARERAGCFEGIAFAFAALGAMPALAALTAFIQ
jgi:hypothetical protein